VVGQANLSVNTLSPRVKHIGKWSIVIHPEFQNKGLGAQMLMCIEVMAKKLGLLRLEVEYAKGNTPAEELYLRKLGYTIEGRKKKGFRRKDGVFVDKIVIGKLLE